MNEDPQEQLRDIHSSGKGSRGGARQEIGARYAEDPMFRKLMMWSWGIFGTAFMAMQVWLVSNVADIKASLPLLTNKDAQLDQHLASTDRYVEKLDDREDRHYDYLKGKVDQYEGKTMRGPPENSRRGN